MPCVTTVCDVDLGDLTDSLPRLDWKSGGGDIYAMIDDFPSWFDISPIVAHILPLYFPGRRLGIHMLSRLVPGQIINWHRDRHDGGTKVRVHVPLASNLFSWFYQSGSAVNMKVGTAYQIDPSEAHSVVNDGPTDRIHLILSLPHK